MEELRSVIVHLLPPALEAEGLAVSLAKHVDVLRRAHRRAIDLDVAGDCPGAIEGDVFRIAQEALHNALRHGGADRIEVRLRCDDGWLELTVADDGAGRPDELPRRGQGPAGRAGRGRGLPAQGRPARRARPRDLDGRPRRGAAAPGGRGARPA